MLEPAPAPVIARMPFRQPDRTRALVVGIAEAWGRHPASRPRAAAVGGTLDEVFRFWRDYVAFRAEKGEVLQAPGISIRRRAGDCDCKTIGVGWCAVVAGWPWRAMLLARHPDRPGELRSVAPGEALGGWRAFHIWPQVWSSGRWVDVETCHPLAELGEHPAALMGRLGVTL